MKSSITHTRVGYMKRIQTNTIFIMNIQIIKRWDTHAVIPVIIIGQHMWKGYNVINR